MKRTIAVVLVAAALCTVPLSSTTASVGGPTCRGQEATHIGTPGEPLTTTPGPDVVVTNDSVSVRTLNGDDIICATGSGEYRQVIVPGGDDDIVDATGFDGFEVETSLGLRPTAGSSGDDIYLGGDQEDEVYVASGARGDHKRIHLDGGDDSLNIDASYPGTATARLGVGRDAYWSERPRRGIHVDGEEGSDNFVTICRGCGSYLFRMLHGAVFVNGERRGSATGFEGAEVWRRRDHIVPNVEIRGTSAENRIVVAGCHITLTGRNGDDVLRARSLAVGECTRHRATIEGHEGDDTMEGTDGDDVLRGGPGDDEADGDLGSDLCRAEVQRNCER